MRQDESNPKKVIHDALEKVLAGEDLTRAEMEEVISERSSGHATDIQFAALFAALLMKGISGEEQAAIDRVRNDSGAQCAPDSGGPDVAYEMGHPQFCPALVVAMMQMQKGEDLSRRDAEAAMEEILSGHAGGVRIASFLAALRFKGETVDELVGFATVMRRHAAPQFAELRLEPGAALVDTAGTGGDARGTFNISTASAFVIAGAGVRVAKHGNRAFSSSCGSADVLEEMGVRMDLAMERVVQAIEEVGIGFLYAPAAHTAMRHAMTARREMKVRTAFNLLGPLTNPAGASAQIVGVYDANLTELLARVLGELGVLRAFVVHGADGLDEISISGETYVSELRDGTVRSYTVAPEDFGMSRAPLDMIRGGDAQHNAETLESILGGPHAPHEHGPRRDIVLANSAAALVAAGRAEDFLEGVRVAAESIDSGAARARLEALIEFTKSEKPRGQTAN